MTLCSLPRSCLVHPVDCFDSEGWFSSKPGDIFNCVSCFLVKKHATFKWKDAISGYPVSLGSAEALVKWGGKIKYILIACFFGNICAKNCCNRTVNVKITASCKGGTFFWDTVYKPNSISIGSCIFVGLTTVTDRQTDHDTWSVTIGHIYVRSTAMWPNNCMTVNVLQTTLWLSDRLCEIIFTDVPQVGTFH